MSTTVIASRHGPGLFLLPAASAALDTEALRGVLARHGQTLVGGSDLASANEIIAAEGLDPLAASRLAEDLRALGLTVRVVNRTALTGSSRVGNALAMQMFIAMASVTALAAGGTGLTEGNPIIGGVVLALGIVAALLAALNALTLQRHGGYRLRVAGTTATAAPAQLTEQLSGLAEHLPDHLLAPIMDRARQLEVHARRDPDGEAAQELQALLDELRGSTDKAAADEARALREEVRRAKQAMAELQKR